MTTSATQEAHLGAKCRDSSVAPHAHPNVRSPEGVMRLARMGSFHASRLSFMRSLLRRLKEEAWHFDRPVWRFGEQTAAIVGLAHGIDAVAVYRARKDGESCRGIGSDNGSDKGSDKGSDRCYSLVCFAHKISDEERSDRVIAEKWDTSFALYDGMASDAEIARLSHQLPRQEMGRFRQSELVVSRANKSVRLFEHTVERLASGEQPDRDFLKSVGYLLRTTAVYGNGKFGIADRERIAHRPLFRCSFHAELFAVFLFRRFSLDYVEQIASLRSPERAVRLGREERRLLGIGNATGLGMAPFLVTHPVLLHRWMMARECALARVRERGDCSEQSFARFETAYDKAVAVSKDWQTDDVRYAEKIARLRSDLARLGEEYTLRKRDTKVEAGFWDGLYRWAEGCCSEEGVELLVSLLLEPQGALVDDLADEMTDESEPATLDGSMSLREMRALLEERYGWCCRWVASERDYAAEEESRYFWYISQEKLEPRLGERASDEGVALEQPLAIGWQVARFYEAVVQAAPQTLLGEFLLQKPQYRLTACRVQMLSDYLYAEIRENLVGGALYPVDLLRCKLSFFGAARFNPRSDRWLQITMYGGAPEAEGDFSKAIIEGQGVM